MHTDDYPWPSLQLAHPMLSEQLGACPLTSHVTCLTLTSVIQRSSCLILPAPSVSTCFQPCVLSVRSLQTARDHNRSSSWGASMHSACRFFLGRQKTLNQRSSFTVYNYWTHTNSLSLSHEIIVALDSVTQHIYTSRQQPTYLKQFSNEHSKKKILSNI